MLEGKRVRLRPLEMSDLERNLQWFNDPEVTYYISARYPVSRQEEEEFLRGHHASSFDQVPLAIETKDGRHIGNLGLHGASSESRSAELGIVIGDKERWSQGYGADAISTLLRFAFQEMNLNRVWLRVFEYNERAIACYRKCGFREEGRLRQEAYKDGRYWDRLIMGILRREFEALEEGEAVAGAGAG